MVKQLRKTRIRKQFNYNRNRKRVNKKKCKRGIIKDPLMKKEWQKNKALRENLDDFGLVFDPNLSFGIPNRKEERKNIVKIVNGFVEEDVLSEDDDYRIHTDKNQVSNIIKPKEHVAAQLESEAKSLRESQFRLPKGVVKQITSMMDKYGLNFKKMERDKDNYDQHTWRQFRAKVRKFLSIPEQCASYLAERNILTIDENDPKWKEVATDDEDDHK